VTLRQFIQDMPKVELHVHLEGSTQPETLIKLARKHNIALPTDTVEGLRRWYTFTDFAHFVDIYEMISMCIQTTDDIELITREFLANQAAQHIEYSEVTYTPYTHHRQKGFSFAEQLGAINRARAWAESELGVTMGLIPDISRNVSADEGVITAQWAIEGMHDGVVALGLGGPEIGNPPEKHREAFHLANAAGLPSVPHAGETVGPDSIWGALRSLNAVRIGHGVRCIEDPALVEELRNRQIPIEVCPTSNVCLAVAADFARHPLPQLIAEGLYVTLNSDDPPMFNTTLTHEYIQAAEIFDFDRQTIERLVMNGVNAALLPDAAKQKLRARFEARFDSLRSENTAG
jgi:aminodeoxyfutalosine deaminase